MSKRIIFFDPMLSDVQERYWRHHFAAIYEDQVTVEYCRDAEAARDAAMAEKPAAIVTSYAEGYGMALSGWAYYYWEGKNAPAVIARANAGFEDEMASLPCVRQVVSYMRDEETLAAVGKVLGIEGKPIVLASYYELLRDPEAIAAVSWAADDRVEDLISVLVENGNSKLLNSAEMQASLEKSRVAYREFYASQPNDGMSALIAQYQEAVKSQSKFQDFLTAWNAPEGPSL